MKEDQIKRLESLGELVGGCPKCEERRAAPDPVNFFAPSHKPSQFCLSGKQPHCTCDWCF